MDINKMIKTTQTLAKSGLILGMNSMILGNMGTYGNNMIPIMNKGTTMLGVAVPAMYGKKILKYLK